MFRSLHMKLVMIILLLIVSLMTVVGAFLVNRVTGFYLDSFYQQMQTVFSDEGFYNDLKSKIGTEDAAAQMQAVLEGNAGALGINTGTRNFYILDGTTGAVLAWSNEEEAKQLEMTPNIVTALSGQEGYRSDLTAAYMDVALPIEQGGQSYIIYIKDNRQTVQSLNNELIFIILEALIFGLVISILLSFLLSKTMITPIERLTDAAGRMADGNLSHSIAVESRDEIGVLTNTFNHMARVLQETLDVVENERNKLTTLFLHMTDGVVAFSRDGKVIHSNPAAEEMLRRTIDTDTAYGDLFESVASLEDVLSLQKPDFAKGEMTVGKRSLELLLAPFSGEVQGGVLAVLHDVTEQRKTEQIRKEFVANVSHELRTPLTNVRSYTETLLETEVPPDTAKGFLTVIFNETERMTHIVQDLLTLSRIDSGKSGLEYERFTLDRAIESVYQANLLEARRHGHDFVLRLPDKLPELLADRGRIEQVMTNVVSNAIKYTPEGGQIVITAGEEGAMAWMDVADSGIGIPEEDKDRIFDRFYRVDKARSRESGGTGLGLSIAKEIALQHGGNITLSDNEPRGLRVRIVLPVAKETEGRSSENAQ